MKSRRIIAVLLPALLGVLGCHNRDYLTLGNAALKNADYRTAEIYFKKAIQNSPRSAQAHYLLGETYLDQGITGLAYAEFLQAARLNPRYREAQVARARMLLAAGRLAEAEAVMRQVLKNDPNSDEVKIVLAQTVASQGKYDEARKLIDEVLAHDPDFAAAYTIAAGLEIVANHRDRALADLDRAIKLDPGQSDAYLVKANYLRDAGQLKESTDTLRRAVAANLRDSRVKLALADDLLAERQESEATKLLRDVAKSGPERAAALSRLIIQEVDTGQLKAAEADMKTLTASGLASQPPALYARARLLIAQNKNEDAYPLLSDLTHTAPQFMPGFYYLGMTASALGKDEEAMQALHKVQEMAPSSPQAFQTHLALAAIELKHANYDDALRDIAVLLAADPKNVLAIIMKGNALAGQGKYEKAEQQYREALTLGGPKAVLHQQLAAIALAQHDPKTAKDEFEAALKADPAALAPLNGVAQILWQTEGAKAAIARIRAQLQNQPKSAPIYELLGAYLARDSQLDAAAEAYRKAIDLDPKAVPVYALLAQVYATQHSQERAKQELRAALAQNPRYVPALVMLGSIEDSEEKRDEAIKHYEEALSISPDSAAAANNLAWDYLVRNGNLDKALELAQRARALMPHDPHIADTLGAILLKRGLVKSALPLLEESTKAMPNSADPHYHLGFALAALEENDRARAELQRGLELNPNAPSAAQARQLLATLAAKTANASN